MTTKEEMVRQARDAFVSGFNCAQSTALPFAALCGIKRDTLLKALSAFGGGVAGLKQTCGVVTGLACVVGLNEGAINPKDGQAKADLKMLTQELIGKFTDKFSTTLCRELVDVLEKKPLASAFTGKYYPERQCVGLVETGVSILHDYFNA